MSSIFEAPASKPAGSGLKIAAAFGAGVLATFVVTQLLPPDFSNAAQTLARAPAQLAAAAPTKAPVEGLAAKTEAEPLAGHRIPSVTAASAAPNADEDCSRRAWPYADKTCAEADTNTGSAPPPVRVIPTDKSSATVALAPTAAETKFVAPQNKDSAEPPKAPPTAASLPTRKSTVAVAPDDAAAAPPLLSRTETSDRPKPPAASVSNQSRAVPPKQDSAPRNAMQKQEPGETMRHGTRETARSKARESDAVANEVRTRNATRRAADPPDDADEERDESRGFSVVRRGTLPDGRRVTVYRKVEGDDGVVSEGENYRVRRVLVSPFGDPEGN